jgi:hypothetical protein
VVPNRNTATKLKTRMIRLLLLRDSQQGGDGL